MFLTIPGDGPNTLMVKEVRIISDQPRTPMTSIAKYSIETGHSIDPSKAFINLLSNKTSNILPPR